MRGISRLFAFILTVLVTGKLAAEEQRVVAAGFPATLIEPQDSRAPIVLFVSGSGPTDRDGNSRLGVSASYLAKLAAGLAEQGVGSLRFDKRGVPRSLPVAREADLTLETFVDDALAVFDWLKARSAGRPLFLLGHSEGGLITLAVAGKRLEAAGLVLLSTPGLPPADTLRSQLQTLEEPLRSQALAITAEIEAGREAADVPEPLLPVFRPSVQPFLRSLFTRRPAEELAGLKIPVLIVGGGSDLQVGRPDFDAFVAARPGIESRWLPDMNHVLVDAPQERTANFATYAEPALPLTPGLVDTIAGFAVQ